MTDKDLADALNHVRESLADDPPAAKIEADRLIMAFLMDMDFPQSEAAYRYLCRNVAYQAED